MNNYFKNLKKNILKVLNLVKNKSFALKLIYTQKIFLLSFVILSLTFFANSTEAGIFDKIKRCFSNPCNCGFGKRKETWGPAGEPSDIYYSEVAIPEDIDNIWPGEEREVSPDNLCPPWNKAGGRRNCLHQFRMPITGRAGAMGGIGAIGTFMAGVGGHRAYCAEKSPNSSFFDPQIRLRAQFCNLFACFTMKKDLKVKNSECKTLPTEAPLPNPTIRFCARLAIPRVSSSIDDLDERDPDKSLTRAEYTFKTRFDPGYYFHFLDRNGFPWPDEGVPAGFGDERDKDERLNIFLPKMCLYEDPGLAESFQVHFNLLNLSNQFDSKDVDPSYQPRHDERKVGSDRYGSIPFSLGNMFSSTGNEVVAEYFYFNAENSLTRATGLEKLSDAIGEHSDQNTGFDSKNTDNSAIIPMPKFHHFEKSMREPVHDFNIKTTSHRDRWKEGEDGYELWVKTFAVKKKESLGCVGVELGPNPPPFCPYLRDISPGLKVDRICEQYVEYDNKSGNYILKVAKSTINYPCIRSHTENNFIKNSIRVSINQFAPICKNGEDPTTNDTCVDIETNGVAPRMLHEGYQDHLPKCNSNKSNKPCVVTKLEPSCVNNNNCESKFRIIYGLNQDGRGLREIDGYASDALSQCDHKGQSNQYPCVNVMGINYGTYTDVTFDLREIDTSESTAFAKEHFNLNANTNTETKTDGYQIHPFISYNGLEDEGYTDDEFAVEANSVCIYYNLGDNAGMVRANCFERAKTPIISATNHKIGSHYQPRIRLNIGYSNIQTDGTIPESQIPNYTISETIGARNQGEEDEYSKIAGLEFDSIVTDDTYVIPPFKERRIEFLNNTESGLTILGDYYNDKLPLTDNGDEVDAKYIGGLEYLSGEYERGGTKIFAAINNDIRCHQPKEANVSSNAYENEYDNTNCVLSYLNYATKIDCKKFKDKGATKWCSKNQKECSTYADPLEIQDHGEVKFRDCGDEKCYDPPETITRPICAESYHPDERVIPANKKELGRVTLHKNEFYNFDDVEEGLCATQEDSGDVPYNENYCSAREKTIIEKGYGTEVNKIPACRAEQAGNANWPAADVGEYSRAECMDGYGYAREDQKRLCYQDNDKNSLLESMRPELRCGECDSEVGPGGAYWPESYIGRYSEGQCLPGLSSPVTGKFKRKCMFSEEKNDFKLEDLNYGQRCLSGIYFVGYLNSSQRPQILLKVSDKGRIAKIFNKSFYYIANNNNEYGNSLYRIKVGDESYWNAYEKNEEIEWLENTKKNKQKELELTLYAGEVRMPLESSWNSDLLLPQKVEHAVSKEVLQKVNECYNNDSCLRYSSRISYLNSSLLEYITDDLIEQERNLTRRLYSDFYDQYLDRMIHYDGETIGIKNLKIISSASNTQNTNNEIDSGVIDDIKYEVLCWVSTRNTHGGKETYKCQEASGQDALSELKNLKLFTRSHNYEIRNIKIKIKYTPKEDKGGIGVKFDTYFCGSERHPCTGSEKAGERLRDRYGRYYFDYIWRETYWKEVKTGRRILDFIEYMFQFDSNNNMIHKEREKYGNEWERGPDKREVTK